MSNESDIELWRLPTVVKKTGLSKSEIYRRIAAGAFPRQRTYPGTTKTFWLASEVLDWLRALLSQTSGATGRSAI